MKYDEVLFIQAEAMQRGWVAGDAAATYQQAIRASIEFWHGVDKTGLNITDRVIENFLANVPLRRDAEGDSRSKVCGALLGGIRGLGRLPADRAIPCWSSVQGTFNDHILPRRLVYPTNTMETNRENYEEALAACATFMAAMTT